MRWSIGLVLAVGGCQFIPGTDASKISEAQNAVARTLSDPKSADFSNDRVAGSGDRQLVCGEVNAKNSFGGYVGFRRYAYRIQSKRISILPALDGNNATAISLLDFPQACTEG